MVVVIVTTIFKAVQRVHAGVTLADFLALPRTPFRHTVTDMRAKGKGLSLDDDQAWSLRSQLWSHELLLYTHGSICMS